MSIADKLTTIAENEQKVYEAGQKSEYDRFWDNYQQNGKRTHYSYAFAGACWKNENLKPKYPIRFVDYSDTTRSSSGMFARCGRDSDFYELIDYTPLTDMIDFSACLTMTEVFSNAHMRNIDIDCSSTTSMKGTFAGGDWGNIDNIKLKVSEVCTSYEGAFAYAQYLKNLTFKEGSVIAASINLAQSPLTPTSMKSVINALKNYSGTDKEYTQQIRFTESCWTALEADSTAPNGGTWKDYVESLGWNI